MRNFRNETDNNDVPSLTVKTTRLAGNSIQTSAKRNVIKTNSLLVQHFSVWATHLTLINTRRRTIHAAQSIAQLRSRPIALPASRYENKLHFCFGTLDWCATHAQLQLPDQEEPYVGTRPATPTKRQRGYKLTGNVAECSDISSHHNAVEHGVMITCVHIGACEWLDR